MDHSVFRMQTVNNEVVDVVWTRPDGDVTCWSLGPTLKVIPHSWTELCR